MHITITRYHESPEETKSEITIDGIPFGEAREPGTASTRTRGRIKHLVRLPEATYECRITASDLSPMTLKVRRYAGQPTVCIGWHPTAPWHTGFICIGQGDPLVSPEERELTDRESTFNRFTQLLYRAFQRGEKITLEVCRYFVNRLIK